MDAEVDVEGVDGIERVSDGRTILITSCQSGVNVFAVFGGVNDGSTLGSGSGYGSFTVGGGNGSASTAGGAGTFGRLRESFLGGRPCAGTGF